MKKGKRILVIFFGIMHFQFELFCGHAKTSILLAYLQKHRWWKSLQIPLEWQVSHLN